MGACVVSRYESRNTDMDDYNTLDVAFMGGDGRPNDKDFCPVDRVFLHYNLEISNQNNARNE